MRRSLIQRNKLGHSHNRIKVGPIIVTGPSKDVEKVNAMKTTPLNNCLLNMVAVAIHERCPHVKPDQTSSNSQLNYSGVTREIWILLELPRLNWMKLLACENYAQSVFSSTEHFIFVFHWLHLDNTLILKGLVKFKKQDIELVNMLI